MELMSKFVENLKQLMSDGNLNTISLAQKAGLSPSAVSRYLRNERFPNLTVFVLLADFFQVSADELLGFQPSSYHSSFHKRKPFSEQMPYLLSYFKTTKYRFMKQTGIAEYTLSCWIKGKYEPTLENVVLMANYFHCPIDFIIGRID